jgi:hypothetical protein
VRRASTTQAKSEGLTPSAAAARWSFSSRVARPAFDHGGIVRELTDALSGERLALTGNYFDGLAIEDCVLRWKANARQRVSGEVSRETGLRRAEGEREIAHAHPQDDDVRTLHRLPAGRHRERRTTPRSPSRGNEGAPQ